MRYVYKKKKRSIVRVFTCLPLLFFTSAFCQQYTFPIADLLPYIEHNPQDSVCALPVCLIENGGPGALVAAPVVSRLLRQYFGKKT